MLTPRAAVPSRHDCLSALLARAAPWLALALSHTPTARALAQPSAAEVGPGRDALRGLVYTGLPLSPRELTVRTSAGYAVTERMSHAPGPEHRLQGGLALGLAPLPWLGFGVRFDGRVEFNADDGMGSHVAGYGEPRVYARAGYALGPEWWLGAQLGAWFPGSNAPSLVLAATSVDGAAQLAYRPRGARYTLLGSLGARLDNSAHSAPDPARLRIGDRIALGVSDSHALLAAIGGSLSASERVDVFAEFSLDALVGARAPVLGESPLRIAAGARYMLTRGLQADVTSILSLSARPSLRPGSAYVPIEPRIAILLGLAYTLPLAREPQKPSAPPPLAAATTRIAPPPKDATADVIGTIVDDRGEPLPDTRVVLKTATGHSIETMSDARGSYRFDDVPLGPVTLETHAVGFSTQTWNVEVGTDLPPQAARALVPAVNAGVLRGLIRSFDSTPLHAKLSVKTARGKLVASVASGDDGRVELELPAGRYTITIEAPGHGKFSQVLQIKGNGVSVLNADMRKEP